MSSATPWSDPTSYRKMKEIEADVRNCYTAIRVKDEENESLKAENERSKAQYNNIIDNQLAEIARLKEEISELKLDKVLYYTKMCHYLDELKEFEAKNRKPTQ